MEQRSPPGRTPRSVMAEGVEPGASTSGRASTRPYVPATDKQLVRLIVRIAVIVRLVPPAAAAIGATALNRYVAIEKPSGGRADNSI